MTVRITTEMKERLHNGVYWTPGATIAEVCESAIRREVDRMEAKFKKYNNGQPFPDRKSKVRVGRPII